MFDSVAGFADASLYFIKFQKFLQDYSIRTTGCTLQELCCSAKDWTQHIVACPQQTNGSDCGVHVCINILCAVFDLPQLPSTEQMIDFMRVKIGVTLMTEKL
jgi:Ulp1 family protease